MPTKNPRVNVVLEPPLYETLSRLARRDGTSRSSKARDLLRDAMEFHEDVALAQIARSRQASYDPSSALTHEAIWRTPARRRRVAR